MNFIQNTTDSSANPVISFADTGTYQVMLKVVSQFGLDSTTQTVQIKSCNTAIGDNFERVSLVLIPNPNDGYFRLRMEGQLNGVYQLELFDIHGKRQFVDRILTQGNRFEKTFDFRHLAKGIYFLRVSDGEQVGSMIINEVY